MSLLGFLGKVATGFITGGPAGAILGGISGSGILKSGSGASSSINSLLQQVQTNRATVLSGAGKPLNPSIPISLFPYTTAAASLVGPVVGDVMPPMLPQNRVQIGPGNTTQGGTTGTDWNGSAREVSGAACQAGYHYNKTGYFTKRYGWVAKGTVCVKNRRRNPLNPRALSRSMSRLCSAKSAAHFLDRVEIRPRARRRSCN